MLNEAQILAVERARRKKESRREIKTEYPGHRGVQDTLYVGIVKGLGPIYQQTFIDTYTKVAFAKLYDNKTALAAINILHDRVLPFFEAQNLVIPRILTDRGAEYCGKREDHEYEWYLHVKGIDHTKTQARSVQADGACERFHEALLQEFYRAVFRKKTYGSLDELQNDLDRWIEAYNKERPHSGKYCFGRTPLQTFLETLPLVKAKTPHHTAQTDGVLAGAG